MSNVSKSTRKRVKTTLTVKLMEGKTLRNMYSEFFKDRAPKGFNDSVIKTDVRLNGMQVPYDLYKKFSGYGANREFLESFDFKYLNEYKVIDSEKLTSAMYNIIPFTTITGVSSLIMSYTTGWNSLDSQRDIQLEIETFSWKDTITAEQVKYINKENGRKLRKYLVSLPSVQGVPYTCTFREDEVVEQECSV